MLISILYWRSVWMNDFRNSNSQALTHSHTTEEAEAFERRLVALRKANFTTVPPTAERVPDRAR